MSDGTVIRSYSTPASPVCMYGAAAAGPYVHGCDVSGRVFRWAAGNATLLQTLTGHPGPATILRLAGPVLYSGGHGVQVRAWDAGNGSLLTVYAFYQTVMWHGMVLSETSLFVSGNRPAFREQHLANGTRVRAYAGHTGTWVQNLELVGALIYSAGYDDTTARRWSTRNGTLLTTYACDAWVFAVTALGGIVVAGQYTGSRNVLQFEADSGLLQQALAGHTGDSGFALSRCLIAFIPLSP